VAIYEYKAQRDDELNVSIGDEFVVRDKSETGWWVVERAGQTGWVPAGCLIDKSANDVLIDGETGPVPGIALYDYNALGVNELSISKDDVLTVFKKYQHWLMAEVDGRTGWVPTCYVSLEDHTNDPVSDGVLYEENDQDVNDDDDEDESKAVSEHCASHVLMNVEYCAIRKAQLP
jgi:hypothetical protein